MRDLIWRSRILFFFPAGPTWTRGRGRLDCILCLSYFFKWIRACAVKRDIDLIFNGWEDQSLLFVESSLCVSVEVLLSLTEVVVGNREAGA